MSTADALPTLLPCPFCGGAPTLWRRPPNAPVCTNCGASAESAEQWNRRQPCIFRAACLHRVDQLDAVRRALEPCY